MILSGKVLPLFGNLARFSFWPSSNRDVSEDKHGAWRTDGGENKG